MSNESKEAAVFVDIKDLKPWKKNPRINTAAVQKVETSIRRFGFAAPIVARKEDHMIIAGHTRWKAVHNITEYMTGQKKVPVRFMDISREEAEKLALADNKLNEIAEWNDHVLKELLSDIDTETALDLGWTSEELSQLLDVEKDNGDVPVLNGSLSEDFLVPPFSILDSTQGYWQDRKKHWNNLIGDDGESRKDTLFNEKILGIFSSYNNKVNNYPTVSILDPVLAEVVCKWFTNDNYNIFDPFAGDTVFGFVAGYLGLSFTGTELRKEQVELNNQRTKEFDVRYIHSDALLAEKYIENNSVDLIFSCPPYADLEVYSDLPNDISNMSHDDFFAIYEKVLMKTYSFLKEDRFAVIVTSEVRNKKGEYINLVGKTISIMKNAGYIFYNDLILKNQIGNVRLRARRFMNSRKVSRIHQNVLVFYKGNPKNIKEIFPAITSKFYMDENESTNL